MTMDAPMDAPSAEGDDVEESMVEALDAEAEASAALALLALAEAMPSCDGFMIEPGENGSLVVSCVGGEADGAKYAVSAAALEVAADELAPEPEAAAPAAKD